MQQAIFILGVCGTFMAGIAVIAKELGFEVVGFDKNFYPPMSNQLKRLGVESLQYDDAAGFKQVFAKYKDVEILVGNIATRDDAIVEEILCGCYKFTSAPHWLYREVLYKKKVIAVSGTHGKTTTASLITKTLKDADYNPCFLIGGVCKDLSVSACVTESEYFVIEADEYDTAFFDKRSKFVHYYPTYLIINNLEFDHADIFKDMDDIIKQFHFLIRIIQQDGVIFYPSQNENIEALFQQGCWSHKLSLSNNKTADFSYELIKLDGSEANFYHKNKLLGQVNWKLLGEHNIQNALNTVALALTLGIDAKKIIASLNNFIGVEKRLSLKGKGNLSNEGVKHIAVYEDFAHHPTAIAATLQAFKLNLQEQKNDARIICVFEVKSNSMRLGSYLDKMYDSFAAAEKVFLLVKNKWKSWAGLVDKKHEVFENSSDLETALINNLEDNDVVVFMSNGDFDKLPYKIAKLLV